MAKSSYKKGFKAFTAFFLIPVFMNFFMFLDMFITDLYMTKLHQNNFGEYFQRSDTWIKYDPIEWMVQNGHLTVICLVWILIASAIFFIVYGKNVERKIERLIIVAPSVAILIQDLIFGEFWVRKWFRLLMAAFWLAYGIAAAVILAKTGRIIDKDNIIEEEYKEPSDSRRRNYYAMMFFFVVGNIYWICYYGTRFYDSILNYLSGSAKNSWISKGPVWDALFNDASLILWAFIACTILSAVGIITLIFYRKILSGKAVAGILAGCFIPTIIIVFALSLSSNVDKSYSPLQWAVAMAVPLLIVISSALHGVVHMFKELEAFD